MRIMVAHDCLRADDSSDLLGIKWSILDHGTENHETCKKNWGLFKNYWMNKKICLIEFKCSNEYYLMTFLLFQIFIVCVPKIPFSFTTPWHPLWSHATRSFSLRRWPGFKQSPVFFPPATTQILEVFREKFPPFFCCCVQFRIFLLLEVQIHVCWWKKRTFVSRDEKD